MSGTSARICPCGAEFHSPKAEYKLQGILFLQCPACGGSRPAEKYTLVSGDAAVFGMMGEQAPARERAEALLRQRWGAAFLTLAFFLGCGETALAGNACGAAFFLGLGGLHG